VTESWFSEINIKDLPLQYQEMAQIIGLENTIKLAEHYGGQHFYFIKIDNLIQKIRNTKIRKEFTGDNYQTLARKYHLSERQLRRIIFESDF